MRSNRIAQVGIPAAIIGVVLMMVVPLPAAVLDLLLVMNLGVAVLILLASMSVHGALEFSAFPSVLLISTMFRLALNVSSTRLVLLDGFAGRVIEAFGHVVIGGEVVVGLVIFLILIVIQFVVITNGAGRVAEVGARFTLDAMPGKQMAIDADLNAGLIDEDTARQRRRDVAAEADFYGAMDGASKFVKGDAIAAILIAAVNLIGGFFVGVVQKGMSLGEAIETYSVLSVGDGLVSQVPALLISISAGLIVTRAATESDLGSDLVGQLGRQGHSLRMAAGALAALALLPGLPKVPFFIVAGALWFAASRSTGASGGVGVEAEPEDRSEDRTDAADDLAQEIRVDPLQLELSFALMDLVDPMRGGDLLTRVRSLRRKIALELGMVVPPVRTRDNVDLPPNGYAIRVHGVEVARGTAPPGQVLVLGAAPDGMPGTATVDPVFGLEATWLPAELAAQAELAGSTVIDRSSVVTAHLAEVVRTHAGRLLTRQDVQQLVTSMQDVAPVVVDELGASALTLGDVQRVLANLLDEAVPIRDLVRILEAVTERAQVTRDTEVLTETARDRLGSAVAAPHLVGGRLTVVTIDPLTEHMLLEALRPGENGSHLALSPDVAERFLGQVTDAVDQGQARGAQPVLVCGGAVRAAVRRLVRNVDPSLAVLSYGELGDGIELEMMGVIDLVPAAI